MKLVSLYSGADSLGDGAIQAGHDIIFAIDKDRDCCRTIKLNHPDIEVVCGSVSDHLKSLPRCDALIAGPPCQNFSSANSGRTFDLTEINNFKKARKITKCRFHFMENVHALGNVLHDKNYIINCADYGVPQKRIRRIFTNMPLPKPTHCKDNWVTVKQALHMSDGLIYSNRHRSRDIRRGICRLYHTDRPSIVITTDPRMYHVSDKRFQNIRYGAKRQFHELAKPAHTVVTKDIGPYPSMMVSDGTHARKLTNEELAVLQGFRKDFLFFGGLTSVRRQIGNALPSAVSRAFFLQKLDMDTDLSCDIVKK